MHYLLHELDCLCGVELDEWFLLDPLGELVDSDVDVLETTRGPFEGSDHIEPPTRKGP